MQHNATRTGPGMARSPSAQRRTVRASLSNAAAAWSWLNLSRASAARNSSADNAAVLQQAVAGRGQKGGNLDAAFALSEAVGERAIRLEQRQALGAIRAHRDKPDGISRHGLRRGGALCVHASLFRAIGPSAQPLNAAQEA